ncbi:unnamed protein product [Linum trigynum]|uniref:Uncharacterized protein n=1 Tax=Linum trigynum TaxID=586398 RepID=A0AAV2CZG3_9ROSI
MPSTFSRKMMITLRSIALLVELAMDGECIIRNLKLLTQGWRPLIFEHLGINVPTERLVGTRPATTKQVPTFDPLTSATY